MKYTYGKSFSRVLYPIQDGSPLQLPTQNPTIYIFRDYPGVTNALSGNGALQTISAWSQSTTPPYGCTYTVAAINNPDINSFVAGWTYYEAINFVATAAGQTQVIIRAFELEILEELDSVPGTTYIDLSNVYPSITSYFAANVLTTFISDAETEMRIELEAKGFKYHQYYNLFKVRLALAYKAIANACLANFKEVGDKFYKRYEVYSEKYTGLMGQLDLPVDTRNTGTPDGTVKGASSTIFITR
jgi:hypothetical protein